MSAVRLLAEETISTPSVGYRALLPIFIVLAGALLGLIVEASCRAATGSRCRSGCAWSG